MTNMAPGTSGAEVTPFEEAVLGKTGRPSEIDLASATNLTQLQKQLKGMVKGNFEFYSSRNRSRVIDKTMADFSAVISHF
jgi:hypothetical protein